MPKDCLHVGTYASSGLLINLWETLHDASIHNPNGLGAPIPARMQPDSLGLWLGYCFEDNGSMSRQSVQQLVQQKLFAKESPIVFGRLHAMLMSAGHCK